MVSFRKDAPRLKQDWGIDLRGITHYYEEGGIASDAAPTFGAVSSPNSGIPAIVNTRISPTVIRALVTPEESETVYGSTQEGNWLQSTTLFPTSEYSGVAVAYGDFNQGGDSDVNANWVPRQSFHFQTWIKYGDLEAERMGAAGFGWVDEKRLAANSVLSKQSNIVNLFGVEGLELYGALNDPNLLPAIQASPKAGQNTEWDATSDPNLIYPDFVATFNQLNKQLGARLNVKSRLKTVIPAERSGVLAYQNSFGITLEDMLTKAFPNMEISTLPEAGAALSGGYQSANVMQMFAPEVEGIETVTTAYTTKGMMHRLESYSSFFRQKLSRGGWGSVWKRTIAVAQMVGI